MCDHLQNATDSGIYDEEYFLKKCGGADSFQSKSIDPRFNKALDLAQTKEGDTVLDIGGGRGELSALCVINGCKVHLIDYSEASLKISQQFLKKSCSPKQYKNIELQRMDAKSLEFESGVFDKIFFLEVLEHLYPDELDIVLSEIRRVAKPNARIVISTGPNAILSDGCMFLSKFFLGMDKFESRKYHVNEQTYFSLKRLLEKHDLRYSIEIGHDKNFFYGQIAMNESFPRRIKSLIRLFNRFYDSYPSMLLRKLYPFSIIVGTHFWVTANHGGHT